MFRYLLSALFIFAISAPSYAETVVHRTKDSNTYRIAPNTYRTEVGGDVSNSYPFDSDGPMRPQTYNWSDVQHLGGNIYRLDKGEWGYTVNVGSTTQGGLAGGEIRVHPVRKRWDVYYSIAPSVPTALSHRQVSDKTLELYVDTVQVRYSFFIGDRGFKINNRLKTSYTGGDEWTYTYNVDLEGLTRSGRQVLHNGVAVGNLPNPFMMDAEGTTAPVQETLSAGTATLTATGISSLVLPIDIDPTLGPLGTDKDTRLRFGAPTSGHGQETITGLNAHTVDVTRTLSQWDISAIPPGATIDSSDLELYAEFIIGSPGGRRMDMYRMTLTDWEDDGTVTVGAEANWNDYKDGGVGGVAWTGGAGALGDTDATDLVSATCPSTTGAFVKWTPVDMTQDALDNRSGILSVFIKFEAELAGSGQAILFSSLESVTAAQRPKLTVVWRRSLRTHLGYRDMVF
jgi:hypothetical protein